MMKNLAMFLIVGFGLLKVADKDASVLRLKPSVPLAHSVPRTLFEVDGRLVIAYPAVDKQSGSRKLRISLFNPKDGSEVKGRFYDAPVEDSTQSSSVLLASKDNRALYYVNLKGAPIILMIDANSLDLLGRSETKYFGTNDYLPHAEITTQQELVLVAGSQVPGQAVHIVSVDASDVSKKVADFTVPAKPGWGTQYKLTSDGKAIWVGGGKHWRKTRLSDGQLEGTIDAVNDIHELLPIPSGVIGLTDLAQAGFLQSFSDDGHQLQTKAMNGCGFVSGRIAPNPGYGVAVCESTGTSEWTFGKRGSGRAIVFNVPSLNTVGTVSVSQRDKGYSPAIWITEKDILVSESDSQGSVRVWHLAR